jgi:acetate kinase
MSAAFQASFAASGGGGGAGSGGNYGGDDDGGGIGTGGAIAIGVGGAAAVGAALGLFGAGAVAGGLIPVGAPHDCRERFPDLPQAVCFDPAFHHDLPEPARRLPLPRALTDETRIRRFGFHGLSYEYVLEHLGPAARGRVVIAHLGNGASMAAVRDGRPIDTSMGLTPAGGFMMGTRSGDLDPGVLLYLMREKGYDADRLDRLVNQESGLRGVSGTTGDVKSLLERRDQDEHADAALTMFCY